MPLVLRMQILTDRGKEMRIQDGGSICEDLKLCNALGWQSSITLRRGSALLMASSGWIKVQRPPYSLYTSTWHCSA